MDGVHSNTSVILHTYQQPNLPDGYVIAAPLNDNNLFGGNPHFSANSWSNPTFSAATYSDAQFGGEISVLNYPEVTTAVYDDFSKESSGTMSDPSLHGGSNTSSSTSDVGSSVDCSMSPEPSMTPSVKRGRPTENPCWSYFHRIDDQLVKCRICTKVVRSACATNMTKHLERHHTEDFEKVSGQIKLCRMNEVPRGKPLYQVSEGSLGSLPVIANQYIFPKMELIESFDSTQYYPIDDNQQFNQFEHQTTTEIPQWPLTHFWNGGGSMVGTGHIGEASTSAIGTSVIQTVNKTGGEVAILQPQTGQVTIQTMQKPGGGKPTKTVNGVEKPYMKRNRKTEHPVWEFFKRTSDGNAECTICQGVVKSPCSSNFMRHLMRHHSSEYNVVYLKWIQKRNITHPGVQYTSVPPPSQPQFLNDIKQEQAIPSA